MAKLIFLCGIERLIATPVNFLAKLHVSRLRKHLIELFQLGLMALEFVIHLFIAYPSYSNKL
jgi:hypothetical protein